jgi:predicted pyridoxine 5'-phosphate oxidase superfamily flavin-nucleotide-binding protein
MGSRYQELAFTPAVKKLQERDGSRASYARGESPGAGPDPLGASEIGFIGERDSFYLSTVGESGWPYLQHRGGPRGFLKVLDPRTLAFADFRGNRQHVSEGNLAVNDRAALILVDYPNQQRLKLLGRARMVEAREVPGLIAQLADTAYEARVERAVLIRVEGWEWNCPQHITPRYSEAELEPVLEPLRARIRELEEQLKFASSV